MWVNNSCLYRIYWSKCVGNWLSWWLNVDRCLYKCLWSVNWSWRIVVGNYNWCLSVCRNHRSRLHTVTRGLDIGTTNKLRILYRRMPHTSIILLQLFFLQQFHLLRNSINFEIFQINNGLFIRQQPTQNLPTRGPKLRINLTHCL